MTTRLTLIPYLQGWDGKNITVNVLSLPLGSPIDQLIPPSATSFATANFKFDVYILTDVNSLPIPQPAGTEFTTVSSAAPLEGPAIFNALAVQFPIDPSPPAGAGAKPPNSSVKKHLPLSYQNAVNYTSGQTSANVYTDDTYSCMMGQQTGHYTKLPPPNPKYAWGRVIAMLLRNPKLAQTAGLIRPFTINIPNATTVKNGGYIYFTLSSTSDASGLLQGNGLKVYASRIPPLSVARDLFSPEFFPVVTPVPTTDYADLFAEVEDYDDGWAKAVHCYQVQQLDTLSETPDGTRPSKDLGVRIGWDDEQVTIWMNRQLDSTQDFDSPLGVQGYRIDARVQGTTEWYSLVHASGPIVIGGLDPIQFDGELSVEVHPVQQYAQKQGDFWLPTYFASWIGRSVVTTDETIPLLMGGPDLTKVPKVRGTPPGVDLRYGTNYDLRVRLADHTGGGPAHTGNPIVPGPQPIASIKFRRWVRPMSPLMISPAAAAIPATPDFLNPPAFLELQRPLLAYPAVVFTGHYPNVIQDLVNDVPAAIGQREPGLVDPDVASVKITVEVAGLLQDPTATDGGYIPLFDTYRSFPTDLNAHLKIDIQWQDFPQITDLQAAEPSTGALLLPTARSIRLRIVAACNPVAEYYGAEDVMYGPSVMLELGKYSSSEAAIFVPALPAQAITSFFFQPDPPTDPNVSTAQQAAGQGGQAPSDIATRAATAFGLPNSGLTMYAPPGRRTVFGCAGAFNHTISPDLSSVTFTSNHDLALHWITVLRLTVNRDWTWNGFAPNGISVQRAGVEVGSFAPNRNVDVNILPNGDRTGTDLIFFDVIDPKVPSGSFPQELNPSYLIVCSFLGSPTSDAPEQFIIRLPVTTVPLQIPKLVSAGIAMSPYSYPENYSNTTPRTRSLWLEFDSAPNDTRDQYFARVLRNVPDPLLSSSGNNVPVTLEPPLPVDPELVRKIVPGEATDEDGLAAMQPLIPSDSSPVHFILPLPPGATNVSPELFGFWTYELRLGHVGMWCTAQGRFGPPLRVAGVQHPAPTLVCSALRTGTAITVTAPFAVPVLNGVVTQPSQPKSTMWALLYAQAARLDGSGEWSNVLIAKARMLPVLEYKGTGPTRLPPTRTGSGSFLVSDYSPVLTSLGFNADAPLSVLAVEMMPQDEVYADPLGVDLGGQRILRTSGLVSVPVIC
ncbi:hypothetical protein NA56DRAFT_38363 [Hyaloscypha hepaticicola]|uniref:Uncharacterized protein n=1 Tax=Hyaloscypha hepaticicola TaxID=2082293 RepID=A0A2J6PDJ3_9HELO|nr:hypothetical protein NA56DRAFT_38363 [Hyaloscypha hepaticicola]